MSGADPIEDCLVLNTVMAARALVRRYDARLKPFGVSVQQFSVLAALARHPDLTLSALADRLAMDRTSLTRTIALLENRDFVRRKPALKGNTHSTELTPDGAQVLGQITPAWRKAQDELLAQMGGDDPAIYLTTLRHFIAG